MKGAAAAQLRERIVDGDSSEQLELTVADGPLTAEQQAAVDAPLNAPLAIVAGAGSGKTETLTRRVARAVAVSCAVYYIAPIIGECGLDFLPDSGVDSNASRNGGRQGEQ